MHAGSMQLSGVCLSVPAWPTAANPLLWPDQKEISIDCCAFQCSAPAVWNSLPQTVISSDSVAVFKLRLRTFFFSQASLLSVLTNTLPGPSASEVTTLWCYTNSFIIIYCAVAECVHVDGRHGKLNTDLLQY